MSIEKIPKIRKKNATLVKRIPNERISYMSTKTAIRPQILGKLGRKITPKKIVPNSDTLATPVYDYAKLDGFFFKCFRVESVVTSFDGLLLTFRPLAEKLDEKQWLNRFEISHWVYACCDLIEKKLKKYVKEVRPSHNALWIRYDFDLIAPKQLLEQIEKLVQTAAWKTKKGSEMQLDMAISKKTVEIPVYFGSDVSQDFKEISQVLSLREKDFISRCTEKTYKICAFSFNMGMPVLDELDDELRVRMKDLKVKEKKIPAGSVVVAENFISVTLFEQHGDWKIIGRACTDLLKKDKNPIFSRGDQISFSSVKKADFKRYLREKN